MGRPLSVPVVFTAALLSWVACVGAALAAPVSVLAWLEPDGSPRFSLPLEPRPDAASIGELTAERWFASLPSVEVELLDGGKFSFGEARGSVLILDFFATWCEPCREELPHFQALFESRRDDGLEALAINVDEPGPLALQFAREMGLTMPVGAYQPAMQPRLYGKALPTVVVADRKGRIRGRWDGYKAGYEREIADLVDRLLTDRPQSLQTIAPVFHSDVEMRIRWLRRTPAPVEALIVSGAGDHPALISTLGRTLTAYESDGRTGKRRPLDRALGRLASSDPARPWSAALAGFRPGAALVTILESPGGRAEELAVPGRILDAIWFAGETDAAPLLALGTTDGLFVRSENAALRKVDGVNGVSSLSRTIDATGAPRLAALEMDGRILWLDPSLHVVSSRPAAGAWRVIGGDQPDLGLGLAPSQVEAAVVGRFVGGADPRVALALESELLLIDPRSGTIEFRAGWAGLKAVAAGDLDGDGVEELVVAGKDGELAALELRSKGRGASVESARSGEQKDSQSGSDDGR